MWFKAAARIILYSRHMLRLYRFWLATYWIIAHTHWEGPLRIIKDVPFKSHGNVQWTKYVMDLLVVLHDNIWYLVSVVCPVFKDRRFLFVAFSEAAQPPQNHSFEKEQLLKSVNTWVMSTFCLALESHNIETYICIFLWGASKTRDQYSYTEMEFWDQSQRMEG